MIIISRLIIIGFLGSIFTMFRFAKFCRLLNSRRNLTQAETEHYQAKARFWLTATGCLLGMAALAFIAGVVIQIFL